MCECIPFIRVHVHTNHVCNGSQCTFGSTYMFIVHVTHCTDCTVVAVCPQLLKVGMLALLSLDLYSEPSQLSSSLNGRAARMVHDVMGSNHTRVQLIFSLAVLGFALCCLVNCLSLSFTCPWNYYTEGG